MSRKSNLLKEIGTIVNDMHIDNAIDVENIDIEILKAINRNFMELEDERYGNYELHYVNEVVTIVFLGLLSNCDEWTQIHLFARKHYEWLKSFLNLHFGIPSVSTLARIMAMINTKDLEMICVNFIMSKINEIEYSINLKNEKDIKVLDGKVIKSSGRKNSINGEIKPVQAMTAYSTKYDIPMATEFIEDKTNEIPTALKLLERLNLENSIITFDALNTQEKTIEYISKSHGDYVAPVKGNQGTLYEDLMAYFDDSKLKEKCKKTFEVDKSHGQIEKREYYLTEDIKWISRKTKWKKLTSIGMVHKVCENINTGEVTEENKYFITSLSETEIEEFKDSVRKEWQIENNLHWQLDFTFKEDKNLTSEKTAQKNLNILRKLGLNILKMAQPIYGVSLKNIKLELCMDFENEISRVLSTLKKEEILGYIKSHKIKYL